MKLTELECVTIPINNEYKITGDMLQHEIDRRKQLGLNRLKGLILSSPSNPTGVMLSPEELQDLCGIINSIDFLIVNTLM